MFVFACFVLIWGSSNRFGPGRLACETNDENTFLLSLEFNAPSLPGLHVAGGRNVLSVPSLKYIV